MSDNANTRMIDRIDAVTPQGEDARVLSFVRQELKRDERGERNPDEGHVDHLLDVAKQRLRRYEAPEAA